MPKGLGESSGLLGAYQAATFFHVAQILSRDAQFPGKRGLGNSVADAQTFDRRAESQPTSQYPFFQIRV